MRIRAIPEERHRYKRFKVSRQKGIDMKIIMIEATAEELRANRTVMDTINDVFRRFTSKLCGVNNANLANIMNSESEEEDEDEE